MTEICVSEVWQKWIATVRFNFLGDLLALATVFFIVIAMISFLRKYYKGQSVHFFISMGDKYAWGALGFAFLWIIKILTYDSWWWFCYYP
jgi:hypothetical protein